VVEDVDESPFVYGYLCDLIEANHQLILGKGIKFIKAKLFQEAMFFLVIWFLLAFSEYTDPK
jgi:hypothetical protein